MKGLRLCTSLVRFLLYLQQKASILATIASKTLKIPLHYSAVAESARLPSEAAEAAGSEAFTQKQGRVRDPEDYYDFKRVKVYTALFLLISVLVAMLVLVAFTLIVALA